MATPDYPSAQLDAFPVAPAEVREALQRILGSRIFETAPAQRRLLDYLVEKTLAGEDFKEFSLAIDVFARTADFDPKEDSIVRTEVRKLRFSIQKYYDGEGVSDPLRIALPKGGYVPHFSRVERPDDPQFDSTAEESRDALKPLFKRAAFALSPRHLGYAAALVLVLVLGVGFLAYRLGASKAIVDRQPGNSKTSSQAAQNDLVLGRFWEQQITPESMDTAIRHFQSAISEDPKSVAAYVGLAESYMLHAKLNGSRWTAAEVRSAALKAVALDEFNGEAHTALAMAAEMDFDWTGAEHEYKIAVLLQPKSAFTHGSYGNMLVKLNRLSEAHHEIGLAADLNPDSAISLGATAVPYYIERNFDKAVEIYKKALSMDPNSGVLHQWLGMTYLAMGRLTEGLDQTIIARKLLQGDILTTGQLGRAYALSGKPEFARLLLDDLSARPGFAASAIAEVYIGLRDNEAALEWLERASDGKDVWLRSPQDPIYDSLRSEPRFLRFADTYLASTHSRSK
jgi:Tfp pilus assembly protein PilF